MESNTINFMVDNDCEPLLKITKDGFWVRGVKVEQDENEATRVYRAFVDWQSKVNTISK